jgi:hypothetical protein
MRILLIDDRARAITSLNGKLFHVFPCLNLRTRIAVFELGVESFIELTGSLKLIDLAFKPFGA